MAGHTLSDVCRRSEVLLVFVLEDAINNAKYLCNFQTGILYLGENETLPENRFGATNQSER